MHSNDIEIFLKLTHIHTFDDNYQEEKKLLVEKSFKTEKKIKLRKIGSEICII